MASMTNIREKDSFAERALRIAIIAVVILTLAIPFLSPGVFASSKVSISGGDSVKGGDTFTLKVVFSGDSVGRVDAYLTYDVDKLTYVSGGSSSGNTGYVQLSDAGTGDSITFNLKFQAVSKGKTKVSVTTNEMYNLDEESISGPSGSKTITISSNASSDQLVTETASPDQPEETTELEGVDESDSNDSGSDDTSSTEEDEDAEDSTVNTNMVLIIGALVAVALIVLIIVLLNRRKRLR